MLILAAVGAVALAGCAGQTDVQQLRDDQFRLRGMIASDNQQIAALQQQIRRQHDAIEEIQHGGTTPGGGNVSDQVASIQDRLNRLEATVSALQASATATGSTAPAAPGTTIATAPSPGTPAAPAPAPAVAPPPWQSDLDSELQKSISGAGSRPYREGLQAMKDGHYALAVSKFALLQKRYPKSPLAEPGEYFSANALFELGKYEQAILQFNDLVMRFPKGRFASAAMLREAQAFLKLNDKIDARLTLQKLIADHGDTAQASAASAMMKDLQN